MISLIGVTVPSMFDMCVMATILVRGVSAASNSSSEKLPSSSTPTHFSTAPLRSRWKCQGTMLEWCSMIESTISSPSPICAQPEGRGDEVDRLGRRAGEDDLVGRARVEEGAHRLARRPRRLRSRHWRDSAGRDARWHIRSRRPCVMRSITGLRLLRRGGIVEIDERLAVGLERTGSGNPRGSLRRRRPVAATADRACVSSPRWRSHCPTRAPISLVPQTRRRRDVLDRLGRRKPRAAAPRPPRAGCRAPCR